VYGHNPLGPLDLLPIHQEKMNVEASKRVKEIQEFHKKVQDQIEKSNERYQSHASKHRKQPLFKPGDLVWVRLRKERLPSKRKSKLMPWADGPFKVLEKINDNTYKVDLPWEYGVSSTFNLADLKPYFDDDKLENLRENSLQQGEDDVPIGSNEGDQVQRQSNPKEVQEVVQVVRKLMEDQGHYPAVLDSKYSKLVTLFT